MKDYYKNMFRYNEWANNRILEVMINEGIETSEVLSILAHLISAQRIWLDRILNNSNDYKIWPSLTFEECITLSKESSTAWIKFLEMLTEEGLEKIIAYKTSKGIPYENKVADIIIHVINHSTYHRAQIAKQIRMTGFDPPNTDYILFVRE